MWVNPKTDWSETDFFNASDYNRIVGNVLYLEDLARTAIGTLDFYDMVEQKANLEMLYADEMNKITANLRLLNIYNYDGSVKTCEDNGTFFNYVELNKIEALTHMLYLTMKQSISFMKHLSFKLGNKFSVPRSMEDDYSEEMYRLAYILEDEKGDIKR